MFASRLRRIILCSWVLHVALAWSPNVAASFQKSRRAVSLGASADGSSSPPTGSIRGCQITQVSDTVWEMSIDGDEADLGRFSQALYQKITRDAKQQRFQGFRPGTIPPHLEPTYKAFCMDECARETVLEAMQQNSIRPFTNCREDMEMDSFHIPPTKKGSKKKKKKKKKKEKKHASAGVEEVPAVEPSEPAWALYETMKEAIAGGWRPGINFSFVARNIKGQQVKDDTGAQPLGVDY